MSNRTKAKVSPAVAAVLADHGMTPADLGKIVNSQKAAAAKLPENIPVPQNADELAEFFGDPGRYSAVLASREVLHGFVAEYGRQQQGDGTALRATIAEETQRALTSWQQRCQHTICALDRPDGLGG